MRRNEWIGAEPPLDLDEVPQKVRAKGVVDISPDFVNPDVLRKALDWAAQHVGIGASRRMGWGRFAIAEWEK